MITVPIKLVAFIGLPAAGQAVSDHEKCSLLPDPAFYLHTDPDPDPESQTNKDPDPNPSQTQKV